MLYSVKGFESFDRMVEGIEISRGGAIVVTVPFEGPIADVFAKSCI